MTTTKQKPKLFKTWYVILPLLIAFAFIGYNYIFQEHRNIQEESAAFIVESSKIASEFSNNLSQSEKKYLNKTVEVNGTVTEVTQKEITLNDAVFCSFSTAVDASVKIDSKITIKGRVIGYDDLLEQVKLDQCTYITEK